MPCVTYETPEEIAARLRASEADRESAMERTLGPLHAKIDIQGRQIAELEAMLCGVLTAAYILDGYWAAHIKLYGRLFSFSEAIQEWFNEAEAGLTWQAVEAWYDDHKQKDEARKAVEAAERERKREAALAKLTPAERELLGL